MPAIPLDPDARPAPFSPQPRRNPAFLGLIAGSLVMHAGLYALFNQPAEPLASIGVEAISIEIVVGADAPAGLSQQSSESEAQPTAPAPNRSAEAENVLQANEPLRAAAPPAENNPSPPVESSRSAALDPEPQPPALDEKPQLPPQEAAPAAEQTTAPPEPHPSKPAVSADRPAHRTAKPRRERNEHAQDRDRTDHAQGRRSASAAPSSSASGIGRGRSNANVNYAGLVAAHLARHKRFPAEARAHGEQGVATIRFSLDGQGRVSAVTLVRSTGVASLDRESQDMARRASPFPSPPDGRPTSFTVPVRFNLM